MSDQADVVIVGAGLAGLVAAVELLEAGRTVVIVEQESEANLGGQAWWSFGGLFLVDTPEQRRMGIRDSHELARQDWFGSAGFGGEGDDWGRAWAEAYLVFASGEARAWLAHRGIHLFPVVGWAERGGGSAAGHGNSVPRFHLVWGTGPATLKPFIKRVRRAVANGRLSLLFRRRVDALTIDGGTVVGVSGSMLAPDRSLRGVPSSREVVGDFEVRARAVLVASGGVGGNPSLVRQLWPKRMGPPPERLLNGVPQYVDGRMLGIAEGAGAAVVNTDRMWHYPEGIANWRPVWSHHGVRILPGPSSLWFDATGRRLPPPLYPGFDTLATLQHLTRHGQAHSWFVLTQRILEKEFALSGSEQNPDLTGKNVPLLLARLRKGAPGPVRAFLHYGEDFVVGTTTDELFAGMRSLTPHGVRLDCNAILHELTSHDRQLDNDFGKDGQLTATRAARRYRGDRMLRVASPHRMLDPANGPLIAVRLHVLTRKTLGGIRTDLRSRALGLDGHPIPGLWAAGEASGFGGGGMHGHRALEGGFLGGCLFTGREAGRSIAAALGD